MMEWPKPRFWWLRKLMWRLVFVRKPKKVLPGQVWYNKTGLGYSGCQRGVCVVAGKDGEDYWHVTIVGYMGGVMPFHGGPEMRFTDKEVLGMEFIGYLPTWKLRLTIGKYHDYLEDRAWGELK